MFYLISFIVVTVFVFMFIGLYAGRKGVEDTDAFLTARSTQSWLSLGTNLFAAGMGVSVLFTFPQIGSLLGIFGVFAYSVAMVVPLLALAILGPILRQKVPFGVTVTEFVRLRFGWAAFAVTNAITLVYMTVFLISELTALGYLLETYNIDALPAQIVLCLTTTLYTALSGMKASLFTDNFQGWIVIALMAIISSAFATNVRFDFTDNLPLIQPSGIAYESLYTLTAACLAANIFHQGYWQRVYSAKNDKELKRASVFASLLTFPIGMTGVIAVWAGLADENDPVAFFKIMATLPEWVHILVLILATAFVSSSVDTLQNGIVATVINDICMNRVSLNFARIVTALLNIPVLFVAVRGIDVMTLFLIADLCAAIVVCPVFVGILFGKVVHRELPTIAIQCASSTASATSSALDPVDIAMPESIYSREDTPKKKSNCPQATVAYEYSISHNAGLPNGFDFCVGVFGGVLSVVLFGTVFKGEFWQGVELLSLPNAFTASGESIGVFIAAPLGSVVAMSVSWLVRRGVTGVDRGKKESVTLFNGVL